MITFVSKGDFSKTLKFLEKSKKFDPQDILKKYGELGVQALAEATPKDSGETAASWSYEIRHGREQSSIYWTNSNVNKGVPIAIILQYGHGTGTGGYVQGRDYISPAILPIFDNLADSVWKELVGK